MVGLDLQKFLQSGGGTIQSLGSGGLPSTGGLTINSIGSGGYNPATRFSAPTPTPTPQPQQQSSRPGGVTPDGSYSVGYNGAGDADANRRAEEERARTLSAIQARLDETKRLAGEQIGQATKDRDYIQSQIETRFPELISRAESRRTTALDDLTGEEKGLNSLYDKANAQARRRSDSAALTNRMMARAGNRLGSSFYEDLVAGNQEGLVRTLGESDSERIDKIAAVGGRKDDTNRYFDETTKDIEYQRDTATQQAFSDYQKQVQAAQALERAGVLDFGEGVAQAESVLNSRLTQIQQWAQSVAMQRMALDKGYTTGNQAINDFQTYSPELTASLGNNAGVDALSGYSPALLNDPTQNPANLSNLIAMSGNQSRRQPTLDDILGRMTA